MSSNYISAHTKTSANTEIQKNIRVQENVERANRMCNDIYTLKYKAKSRRLLVGGQVNKGETRISLNELAKTVPNVCTRNR